MKIKNKKIEEKIYEFMGIKYFKKIIISLGKIITKDNASLKENNYFLHRLSVNSINNFKKNGIRKNIIIHLTGVLLSIVGMLFTPTFLYVFLLLSNLYCVMLQRYNYIRVNKVLKKLGIRENRRQELSKSMTQSSQNKNIKDNDFNLNDNKEVVYSNAILNSSKEISEYVLNEYSNMSYEEKDVVRQRTKRNQ